MKLIFAVLYVSLNDGPYTWLESCSFLHSIFRKWLHEYTISTRFAIADHRGQDPTSGVLSFEGPCYYLIQIQIQHFVSVTKRVKRPILTGDW